jgi:hypothetical protein
MKKIHKYDTPETTFRYEADKYTTGYSAYENMRDHSRDLKQRLAACRDALARIASCLDSESYPRNGSMESRLGLLSEETLTITAPK